MSKKKNSEQETTPVEDQEPEVPTEQEDTPAEETPAQEEEPQKQEVEEQEEDPAGEEDGPEEEPTDDEEEPQEQPPGSPAQEQPATDETAKLRSDLLQAQGKLAAYAAGVAPGVVDDAVTLAMAEAAKSGEVTEATVTKAMEAVLKRHPEWKADSGKKQTGGFKIGADRDNGGSFKKPAGNTNQNVKRWNRFK